MSAGRVIVLNGTSSSGKTSLARALQERLLPDVWLLLGIDPFITALPWGLYGTAEGHDIHEDGSIDIGPVWRVQQEHWRAATVALVRSGANVILDEVFLRGHEEQAEWRRALDGVDVRWVGVHCDVDVADARERARGDRTAGQARWQRDRVHVSVEYDVEVDTTSTPADVLAVQLQIG